jgi:formylglycine-generating enzyme required for sulfatase activity
MARIEKTIFISYRRTDVYTALAVYENLKNQGYDVFFDYRSISSGDFEQIISSNIRARAHFLLILTSTALDRCSEPDDWLRREIEIAMDEKRNIIPLFFKGFRFGDPSVDEKLTGKLKNLGRYNGLNVHEDYFDEAMHRLRTQYLNIPLNTVLHPVSTEVRKVVREEQLAADKALEQIEDVQELVKQGDERTYSSNTEPNQQQNMSIPGVDVPEKENEHPVIRSSIKFRVIASIAGGLVILSLLLWGSPRLFQNRPAATVELTNTTQNNIGSLEQVSLTATAQSEPMITPSPTATSVPATATLGISSSMTGNDGMTLLYVPAGEFTMGSNNGNPGEKPAHPIYLDAFWIDKTEVTNKMYSSCVAAGVCKEPTSRSGDTNTRSSYYSNPEFNNYPVIYVYWDMAKTYCEWAGRRLPTEAEWEKAARGTDGRSYPWGNESPNEMLANYARGVGATTEVGEYPNGASPYGALDMAGNVWEWVNDWYDVNYYATLGEDARNLQGPTNGRYRVLRGGSWSFSGDRVRSSYRYWSPASYSGFYGGFGFRCAMSATP